MNIVVLAKQVPNAEALIEITGEGRELAFEQKFAMNFFDEFALEEALRIRERHGGRVKVITLGTGKATEAMRTRSPAWPNGFRPISCLAARGPPDPTFGKPP